MKGHQLRWLEEGVACSCQTWSACCTNNNKKMLRELFKTHIDEVLWHMGIGRIPTV